MRVIARRGLDRISETTLRDIFHMLKTLKVLID